MTFGRIISLTRQVADRRGKLTRPTLEVFTRKVILAASVHTQSDTGGNTLPARKAGFCCKADVAGGLALTG